MTKKIVLMISKILLSMALILLAVLVYGRYYPNTSYEVSLEQSLDNYVLTTDSTPWEIIHAIIAYGKEYQLFDPSTQKNVSAVEFLCTQKEIYFKKKKVPYIDVDGENLRFIRTDGQGIVQGHRAQFLAKLLAVGVGLDQEVDLYTKKYTVEDLLKTLLNSIDLEILSAEVPVMGSSKYREYELGWIVEAFSFVQDSIHEWTNERGQKITLEKLLDIMLQRPIGWGSCGGTHELAGLAICMKNHQARGKEIDGVWKIVQKRLQTAKLKAKKMQNKDGSYDRRWTAISIPPSYLDGWKFKKEKIRITGHMLAWLVIVSDEKELDEPFIKNAYHYLKSIRIKPEDVVAHIGEICHAVEAILLYEKKKKQV